MSLPLGSDIPSTSCFMVYSCAIQLSYIVYGSIMYSIKIYSETTFNTHLIQVYYVLTRFITFYYYHLLHFPFLPFTTINTALSHCSLQFAIWEYLMPFIPFITYGVFIYYNLFNLFHL